MPSDKRERQKQGRLARQEQLRAQQRRAQNRKRAVAGGAIALIIVLVALLFSRGGGNDDSTDVAAGASTTTVPGASTTSTGPPGEPAECPAPDGSAAPRKSFPTPPPTCIDAAKTYTATVETDVGSFTIALDAGAAPATVNNFVFLARYHYYDDVPFHRVIPGFVVQGGDGERGDGTGGPGYSFDDELPEAGAYQVGSVAMANSGADTNGSQFFVVTGPQGVALPPNYSLFGTVDAEGMKVVKAIEADGSAGGTPTVTHTITTITVNES